MLARTLKSVRGSGFYLCLHKVEYGHAIRVRDHVCISFCLDSLFCLANMALVFNFAIQGGIQFAPFAFRNMKYCIVLLFTFNRMNILQATVGLCKI